jgi:hypothetical protein
MLDATRTLGRAPSKFWRRFNSRPRPRLDGSVRSLWGFIGGTRMELRRKGLPLGAFACRLAIPEVAVLSLTTEYC